LTTVAGHIKDIWNLSGGPGAPPTAYQEDYYTLKGGGEEVFQQKFGFQAFRYVEITGYSGKVTQESLVGLRLNSDLPDHGSFTCSNELFNQIQEVTKWTMLSNVFSIQSDCPGREKFGYGGDIITAAEAYIHNYDMANFYRKAARDFQDDVRPNGGLPETAPYNGIDTEGLGEGSGPIGWQLAHPFVVQQLYRYYGDRQIVEEQYPVAKRALEFLRTQAPDHYIEDGIGDHVSLSYKAVPFTSTAFYYHFTELVAEFAEILGKQEEAQMYRQLVNDIEAAFKQRFVNPTTAQLDSAVTQANQVFGLYYGVGLDAPELTEKALQLLLDNILETGEGHLTTGIFSTKMLWDVLDQYEQNEIAYTINNQRDFPSYGYMLA
ncbi:MAG: family 78 glycoside hydrolase catalytic domain, partial [Bacteroidota bacterium]